MWIVGFPAATIDGVSFTDCTFAGVENAAVLSHAGTVTFRNATIEPLAKGRSRNSNLPAEAKP